MRPGRLVERAPLLDGESLRRYVEEIRSREETLVFTNGCFDLIHPGHVHYLFAARELGDHLLVAVNSDASLRKLKGPGRPLIPASGRVEVLASLRAVDAVVLFEEETPLRLILEVRPDVLVKGGDYRPEEVVGGREVASWGGRLEILPFQEGFATSSLIHRIRNL